MAGKTSRKLGEILIEDGLLKPAQLEEALKIQGELGGLIGQVLIEKGFVEEDSLVSALGKQFRLPYIPLKHYAINPDIAELLKSDFCHKNLLVPFDGDAHKVLVAISDPLNDKAIEQIKELTQRKPKIFISRISEIRNAIYFLYHEDKV